MRSLSSHTYIMTAQTMSFRYELACKDRGTEKAQDLVTLQNDLCCLIDLTFTLYLKLKFFYNYLIKTHLFSLVCIKHRAGYSLSRARFRKKMCGPLTWGGRPYFSWKKLATFFSHHRLSTVSSAVSSLFILFLFINFLSRLSLLFTRSLGCHPLFPACCYVAKNCRSSYA